MILRYVQVLSLSFQVLTKLNLSLWCCQWQGLSCHEDFHISVCELSVLWNALLHHASSMQSRFLTDFVFFSRLHLRFLLSVPFAQEIQDNYIRSCRVFLCLSQRCGLQQYQENICLATAELLIKSLDRGDLEWREMYK